MVTYWAVKLLIALSTCCGRGAETCNALSAWCNRTAGHLLGLDIEYGEKGQKR